MGKTSGIEGIKDLVRRIRRLFSWRGGPAVAWQENARPGPGITIPEPVILSPTVTRKSLAGRMRFSGNFPISPAIKDLNSREII
jgi:hypothetical protein